MYGIDKKKIAIIAAAIFFAPLLAFATASSVNRITDHIEPLINTDYMKAVFFTASSTTNHSTFPNASTTALSAGTICFTGDTCRTTWPGSTGSAYPFTPSTNSGIPTSATSTAIDDTAGLFVRGSPVATTSLVVCLQGPPTCQYTDPETAVLALPSTGGLVHIKTGTYILTQPLVIPTGYDHVVIEGEGQGTVLRWSRFNFPTYFLSGGVDEKTGIVLRDLELNQSNSSGASNCIDFGHFADSYFQNLQLRDCSVMIMASTSAFENHFDNIEIHTTSDASSAVAVYNGANDNIFTNVAVSNGADTVKGFYFDAHSNKCYLCDVESFASYGLYLGPNADDFIGDMYLELNQTNAYVSAGANSVNLQGFYSSASTTGQDILNGGATGLRVNADVEFANRSYFTGDNYGLGTSVPSDALDVSNEDNLTGQGSTRGLFGAVGTAIGIWFKSGATAQRYLVNDNVSPNFNILDVVLNPADETGVRMDETNQIGTGDVAVQLEASSTGYAIFEGSATSTVAGPLGTIVNSKASPVILETDNTDRLHVDNTTGNIGIASTTPGTKLSIGASLTNYINIAPASTSTFSRGLNIAVVSGCLAVNGVCVSTVGGGGGGGGTGTVGTSSAETATQVPFWTTTSGATALLSGGNNTFTFTTAANRLNFTYASTTALTVSGASNMGSTTMTNFNLTSASATSTSGYGLDIAAGCFAVDGTCLQTLVSSASAFKQAVVYASTSTLPANSYNNGSSGVGATITSTALAPLFIDGNTATLGQRILVKNEGTGANNGVYTVTTAGVTGVAAFVLTRATDYNSSADVFPGVANFVNSGTVNANTCWILTNTTAVTIGTTALTYDDACGAGSLTGTSPIVLNGTNITFVAPATSALSIPYASSTVISTLGSAYFATAGGAVGIATSTPWGIFSVVSASNPIVSIASSTNGNPFFNIFSTTTIQQLASSVLSPVVDLGIRIGIGTTNYLGFGGLLDQFVVRGRINTEGWDSSFCDIPSAQGGSSQSNFCGNFAVGSAIATNPVITDAANNAAGYGYAASNISVNGAAGAGAAFYFSNNSGTTGWLVPATTSPVMELNARIEFPQNSTSSRYYIGFDGNNKNGTMVVTAPTNGCFFTASSSASFGDWWAVAVSGGTGTYIDTKVASSTNVTSKGGFYKFRLEASNNLCNFYIQNAQQNPLTLVASITTNVPNTAGLNASEWLTTDTLGATQVALDFNRFRVWWRDFLPTI